jgi:hypothetical protein
MLFCFRLKSHRRGIFTLQSRLVGWIAADASPIQKSSVCKALACLLISKEDCLPLQTDIKRNWHIWYIVTEVRSDGVGAETVPVKHKHSNDVETTHVSLHCCQVLYIAAKYYYIHEGPVLNTAVWFTTRLSYPLHDWLSPWFRMAF